MDVDDDVDEEHARHGGLKDMGSRCSEPPPSLAPPPGAPGQTRSFSSTIAHGRVVLMKEEQRGTGMFRDCTAAVPASLRRPRLPLT